MDRFADFVFDGEIVHDAFLFLDSEDIALVLHLFADEHGDQGDRHRYRLGDREGEPKPVDIIMREPVHQRYDRQHAVEHDKQVGKTALLGRLEERPHDVDDRQYRNVDGENTEGDREYGGDRRLRQAVERRELNGKQLGDDQHQNREPHGDDHAVAQGEPLTVGILFTVQGAEDRQQRH